MRHLFLRLSGPVLFLTIANPAAAQSFIEFCPNGDEETEAAVVGYLTDGDTVVPAATVAASWVQDDARQRIEVQTSFEGLYIMCGLPKGTEVSLRGLIGNRRGEAVPYTTAAPVAQQDLTISLSGDPESRGDEIGSLSSGGSGGSGRAFSSEIIRSEDLLDLPEMSVYDLLRRHQLLRFERVTGGETIFLVSATSSARAGGIQSIQLRINERREADPIGAIRDLSIDEIGRIEILTRTEASARYGGDGFVGAISITMRDR